MKGATKVSALSRCHVPIVYEDHPAWPLLCSHECPQLRSGRNYGQSCVVFGDLQIKRTPGSMHYVRAGACIQLGPQYRCKHKQICVPQNAKFVDGCGWQGTLPRDGKCPSCGSTILREVKT